jgi:hypothetical protein
MNMTDEEPMMCPYCRRTDTDLWKGVCVPRCRPYYEAHLNPDLNLRGWPRDEVLDMAERRGQLTEQGRVTTLQVLANERHVTRERIRQVLDEAGLLAACNAAGTAMREYTREKERKARKFRLIEKSGVKRRKFTNGQILAHLRDWLDAGGDGKARTWQRDHSDIFSVSLVYLRFDNWADAISRASAGRVNPERAKRSDYTPAHVCAESVARFLADDEVGVSSFESYKEWARVHKDEPGVVGAMTVRHRFNGSWNRAKAAALDHLKAQGILV